MWSKQNKFSTAFCSSLLSHTQAEHAAGAWLLLAQVARCTPNLPLGPVLQAWDHMIRWVLVRPGLGPHDQVGTG